MATMQEIMEAVKEWWGQIPNVQDGNVQTQPQLPLQFSTQPAGYQHPDDYSGYAATHPGSIRTKQSGVGSIAQQNMGPEALTDKSEFDMYDASNPNNTGLQQQAMPMGGIGGSENTDKKPFNFGKLLRGILPIAIPTVAGAVLGSRSGTFGPLAGGLYGLAAGASGATERQHEMAQLKQKEQADQMKYFNDEKNRILEQMKINSNNQQAMLKLNSDLQKIENDKAQFEKTHGLAEKNYSLAEKKQTADQEDKKAGRDLDIFKTYPKSSQLIERFKQQTYGKNPTYDQLKEYIKMSVASDPSIASELTDVLPEQDDGWWSNLADTVTAGQYSKTFNDTSKKDEALKTFLRSAGIIVDAKGNITLRVE